jgi:hypothetical protein
MTYHKSSVWPRHYIIRVATSVRHGYGYGSEISHCTRTHNNCGYTVKGIHRTRIFTGTYVRYTVSLTVYRITHNTARVSPTRTVPLVFLVIFFSYSISVLYKYHSIVYIWMI